MLQLLLPPEFAPASGFNFYGTVLILLTWAAAVSMVFLAAVVSIFVTQFFQAFFDFIVQIVVFIGELITALVAAVMSGTTITMAVVFAAISSSLTVPARMIHLRIAVAIAVSFSSMIMSQVAFFYLTKYHISMSLTFSIAMAASGSVACATAWAVGVMSLIEKESRQIGFKMSSILDTVRHNNHRLLRILVKIHFGVSKQELDLCLHHAVRVGYTECAKILLGAGADPNAHDLQDGTPLSLACETGNHKIARMLIKAGALVNVRNGRRGTPLHLAAKWGHEECVIMLLQEGADPHAQDGGWNTPLMLAAGHAFNSENIMRRLIDAGTDVNKFGSDQRTALHYAAARGVGVKLLLAAGATPTLRDSEGNTPLHLASRECYGDVISDLLAAGCDPNDANHMLKTPLHLAAMRGHLDSIQLLVTHGADPLLMDSGSNLPIYYAALNNNFRAVVYFVQCNCPLGTFRRNGKQIFASNPLSVALNKRHMEVAQILVLAGCDMQPLMEWVATIPEDYWNEYYNFEHFEWLKDYVSHPVPLQQACRLCIRKVLPIGDAAASTTLPLPKAIIQYISMRDIENINEKPKQDQMDYLAYEAVLMAREGETARLSESEETSLPAITYGPSLFDAAS